MASAVPRYRGGTATGGGADSSAYQRSQYGGGPTSHHQHQQNAASEAENEAILAALLKNVQGMRTNLEDINSEVKTHLTLLDRLMQGTSQANDRVQGTVRKLQEVSGLKSAGHVWFLVLVAFFVFLFLVLLLKSRGV